MSTHIARVRLRSYPAFRRPAVLDNPSGKFDKSTPEKYARLRVPPPTSEIPRTNDSGIPSKIDPNTIPRAAPLCSPRALLRLAPPCLLYTSDAADEEDSVDLGGR